MKSTKSYNKAIISDSTLNICYKTIDGQHIEFTTGFDVDGTESELELNLSDYGDNKNRTVVKFNSIEHLENIIKDLKIKLNKIK